MQVQKGSGIICAMMAMGGLLTLMGLVIRYTTYGIDIAHQRVLYEQRYFALRGLLNYGLMLAERPSTFNSSDPLTLEVDPWLTLYTGKIAISKGEDAIHVQATLYITPKESISMQQNINS